MYEGELNGRCHAFTIALQASDSFSDVFTDKASRKRLKRFPRLYVRMLFRNASRQTAHRESFNILIIIHR